MFTDQYSILARWTNHVSQLLNVQGVNDVRQTEIHTAEPVVPESSASEDEVAIEKLKSHKSPGIDQIPAELIKAGNRTIRSEFHKLIISVGNKGWKESIIVPTYKKGDKTDCSNYRGISILPPTYTILSNILLSMPTPYAENIIGNHPCGFRLNRSTTDHIRVFCIRQIIEKKLEYNEAVHQIFTDFKKTCDSLRREVL